MELSCVIALVPRSQAGLPPFATFHVFLCLFIYNDQGFHYALMERYRGKDDCPVCPEAEGSSAVHFWKK